MERMTAEVWKGIVFIASTFLPVNFQIQTSIE